MRNTEENFTRLQKMKAVWIKETRIATLKEVLKEAKTCHKTARKFSYFIHRLEAKIKEVEKWKQMSSFNCH